MKLRKNYIRVPARFLALCVLATSACTSTSPFEPSEGDRDFVTPPLHIASTGGCQIDSDCALGTFCMQNLCVSECSSNEDCSATSVCSDRGRCLDPRKVEEAKASTSTERGLKADEERFASTPSTSPITLREWPVNIVEIGPNDDSFTVEIETSEEVPEGAILYRWVLEGETTTSEVRRAEGSKRFTLTIPAGSASGTNSAPIPQRLEVITSVGSFPLTVRQSASISGDYAGEVFLPAFGSQTLPFRFSVEVIPANATLDEATAVYLSLPTSLTDIFSLNGVPTSDETHWERAALERDGSTGAWFARFASTFTFPEGSAFADHATPQRALRVELWSEQGGEIKGAIIDRWSGLFSNVNADGIVSPGQFVLSGEFNGLRAGLLSDEPKNAGWNAGNLAAPQAPPPAPITACNDQIFAEMTALVDSNACEGVDSLATLNTIAPLVRLQCVNAIAEVALEGQTTAQMILDFLDDEAPNPDGLTFKQFLERCAARDGYCDPTPEVECATMLTSNAYRRFTFSNGDEGSIASQAVNQALTNFQFLSREMYLGSQLAAFQVDTNTRLEWLRSSIAPAFLASELRALNETMLARWEANVLDAHYGALRLQVSPWALDVLARTPQDASAAELREAILLDNITSWQSTMEALQLAAKRWHEVMFLDSQREAAANKVKTRTFDLYVAAGLLAHLNQTSELATTMANFGSGFSSLQRGLHDLSLSYSELLFARDAEVVLPRSADPTQDQTNLLADRENLARIAIRDAQTSVDMVLTEATRNELSAEVLTNSSRTQRDELRSELIQLCGVPAGCDPSEVGVVVGCEVRTREGECGFQQVSMSLAPEALSSNQFNVSEAASALNKLLAALANQRARAEELIAQRKRLELQLAETNAFADHIKALDQQRRITNATIDRYAEEMASQRLGKLSEVAKVYEDMAQNRADAFERQRGEIEDWSTFLIEDSAGDYETMLDIAATYTEAARLSQSGDLLTGLTEAATELIGDEGPNGWTITKAAILTGGVLTNFGLQMGAITQNAKADRLEALMEYQNAVEDAQVGRLQSLSELNSRISDAYIEQLSNDLALLDLKTDHEIRTREAMMDSLRRALEQDTAFENDLQELRDRRAKTKTIAFEIPAIEQQVLRAEIQVEQAFREYQLIAQRAGLIEGRFALLSARLSNIENILGSPATIFAFANRIARAESRVERAKTALYDWLVALEYYAVRPFMDQRTAILLARNPSELEAIANELGRLQRVCGGPVNYETLEVSVRDNLLGLSRDNLVDGSTLVLSPAERFRALLQRKSISVNAQARYSSSASVGDILRQRSSLGAEFKIRLDDFANLAQTCNTKIRSFGIAIVGEGLNEDVFPTVSLVHDGEAELISCQPDIKNIVRSVAPGSTVFDRVTKFRTAGRSVTPVARVNSFGDVSVHNRGLEGLPLSSTYALLINPDTGDNRYVDWSKVEDIRLQITYAYQDVFPSGQCR